MRNCGIRGWGVGGWYILMGEEGQSERVEWGGLGWGVMSMLKIKQKKERVVCYTVPVENGLSA